MSLERTKVATERLIGVAALVLAILAPAIFSSFWLNSILTQALILGIGAASLIFLSAYGGMISLAQSGLMGIAGYALLGVLGFQTEWGLWGILIYLLAYTFMNFGAFTLVIFLESKG